MTEPSAPTLEGYTFAGWYTDEACTTQWNFATGVVDRNLELYAKWNEIEVPEPVIDTAELQKLVDEMDRVDLEKYEKDAAYDAFVAALQNAKAVLTDPESEQAVAEAKAALTEAYANLKLIEMPEPEPTPEPTLEPEPTPEPTPTPGKDDKTPGTDKNDKTSGTDKNDKTSGTGKDNKNPGKGTTTTTPAKDSSKVVPTGDSTEGMMVVLCMMAAAAGVIVIRKKSAEK